MTERRIRPIPRPERELGSALLEAIDITIGILLGADVTQALYDYLERDRALRKAEIPDRVEEFSAALETVAGKASQVIERQIMKRLNSILQLAIPEETTSLPGYMKEALVRMKEDVGQ